MNVQVLVATMNQTDHSLLEKMNIQSDVIVGNQCDRNEIEEFSYKSHSVKWLSFKERGVGLNRNNALMRAEAEIVLFADDDVVYETSYEKTIEQAFLELPDADVIIFDLKYPNKQRKPITKVKRLKKRDCMRFGAARIAARLNSIKLNGISFNLCFGGGTVFSSGEDTLFLNECLKKKLRIYSYPAVIACLQDERQSTWFEGYTDKFFYDKGVLFAVMNPAIAYVAALFHCTKHKEMYSEYGYRRAVKQMFKGIRYVKGKE
ncbi:MAG: glycosyltransferase family 2 protein [Ruminococcaceae bacterium]|nr:glycosyltransferase family 2 protein [Oscillospiraceae bacterium]